MRLLAPITLHRKHCNRPPHPAPPFGAASPLQPITMMRNALGREEGGSGVPLERAKYEAATAYWESHAAIQ